MCCLLFTKAPSEVPLSLGFLQAFPGTCSSMLCCEALRSSRFIQGSAPSASGEHCCAVLVRAPLPRL